MSGDGETGDYAMVVWRDEGQWDAGLLPERLTDDFDGLVRALRQQPGDGSAIGLVNVSDEFFLALRVGDGGTRVLLSDVTAAVAWDLAAQACSALGAEVPQEEDLDDVHPIGDMTIFADLGLGAIELDAMLEDTDLYADEVLEMIAARLGFGDPYDRVLEAALR